MSNKSNVIYVKWTYFTQSSAGMSLSTGYYHNCGDTRQPWRLYHSLGEIFCLHLQGLYVCDADMGMLHKQTEKKFRYSEFWEGRWGPLSALPSWIQRQHIYSNNCQENIMLWTIRTWCEQSLLWKYTLLVSRSLLNLTSPRYARDFYIKSDSTDGF